MSAEPMTVTLVPYDGRALGELLREIEALPEYRIDNKPLIRIHDALADLHYGWVGYQPSDEAADAALFERADAIQTSVCLKNEIATQRAQLARRDFFIRHAIDQLDKAATTAANSGQKAREYDCGPMNTAIGTLRNALTNGPLTRPYDGWRLVSGEDGLRVERMGDGR